MTDKKQNKKPVSLSEEELSKEVTEIEMEAFDIISELVEEELKEKRRELSYSEDRKFRKSWCVKNPESINGSKTNDSFTGYAASSQMMKLNEGDFDA